VRWRLLPGNAQRVVGAAAGLAGRRLGKSFTATSSDRTSIRATVRLYDVAIWDRWIGLNVVPDCLDDQRLDLGGRNAAN
jgi:hypothetical protein